MEIVFATHNKNKVYEVQLLVPKHIKILSLEAIGCFDEIPETADTLAGNAKLKADYVTQNYKLPCFADDTGLLVESLNGAPGVLSARYAGEQKDATDNMDKLLAALENKENRKAKFETVIALNLNGQQILFNGVAPGEITIIKSGVKGFGYDPIFKPEGYDKTFAELPVEIKNTISHRGKAMKKLLDYLNKFE
ncbi:non-canonical purine NTP diphosphatase [Cellulophaga baltica]|uniref:dITP/XTP pyrophosphatase n=1 Tax=Cellulophaga baltica 18 TaxID=1348584 RepID=A0AAU8RLR4_9FLAO|nr:non-canonical purine NTP diphosphatase [Cellulophaga baltica]AIY14901.1 deoxyribonucleotide triphosphate pyrophosphatase [Cellulophaga baltica NN016038]AIZ43273.1 deoxyribonucleotide triphosphate pyrophosphatase [Cellulophaga baltica 18]MBA6316674.1 non-canonical purine NTP diphosphatase [Cellulophaga baltica]